MTPFREEARAWLEQHVEPVRGVSSDTAEGFAKIREWERTLFSAGFSALTWPRIYGGRDASLADWLIFEEEYFKAGGPHRVTQNGINLLAPSLFEFGTEDQKARLLRRMASGEDVWCQGWSEPNAGSDLASLTSYAVRDNNSWRLFGQKTWCTRGAFCTGLFGLFRTDPVAPKHKGLTYFLVPLDTPGVTVRPVARFDGEPGFAEIFFDGAMISDDSILGGVNQGWHVAMATTASERGANLRSPGRFLATASRLVSLCKEKEHLRDEVTAAWIKAQAYNCYTWQNLGKNLGASSSMTKVFWSEMDVELNTLATQLLDADALLHSEWMSAFQFSLAGPIYAGTNEIQRNVIAERLLGLPRS